MDLLGYAGYGLLAAVLLGAFKPSSDEDNDFDEPYETSTYVADFTQLPPVDLSGATGMLYPPTSLDWPVGRIA